MTPLTSLAEKRSVVEPKVRSCFREAPLTTSHEFCDFTCRFISKRKQSQTWRGGYKERSLSQQSEANAASAAGGEPPQ
eukprot:6186213-Pleurochrysis_carterae.AAC.4